LLHTLIFNIQSYHTL